MISKNIKTIKKELEGNNADLVVVTKYQNLEDTALAIKNGANIIGESKIQNAVSKKESLDELGLNYKLHIIGHLQSNKAKKAVEIADMIQSIDSYKLAKKIDKEAGGIGKKIDILLQLNLTEEDQKFGILENNLDSILEQIKELENINLCGLMCMGQNNVTNKTQEVFQKLKKLVDNYSLQVCSMGMTGDYQIALECGSNMVRIGSKIFK